MNDGGWVVEALLAVDNDVEAFVEDWTDITWRREKAKSAGRKLGRGNMLIPLNWVDT